MQQVHFCSGSVFVTGDAIAISLLRYVEAVAAARRSDVLTVPTISRSGSPSSVTLMVNAVSQISADRHEHDGPELEDDVFLSRLEERTREISLSSVWLGEGDVSVA